jgi:hypothetical protein
MKVHLFDFRWRHNADEKNYFCEFEASSGDRFGAKKIKIGDKISMEIVAENSDQKRCAGSMVDGKWQKCPQAAVGKPKCEICRSREKNFVFTVFDGFNFDNVNDADLEKIAGPHVVYFALFSENMIKIGVSKADRKSMRQIEQGSHFTLFVAETPDGTTARQIETLFRKSGIADKINASMKKDFLCPEISKASGEKILRDLFESKVAGLDEFPHLKKFLLELPEFCSWEEISKIDEISAAGKPFHFVELKKGESVSGEIIAIKGGFIAIDAVDEIVSIAPKKYAGLEIEFEEKPAGLVLSGAFQKSLF